MKHILCGIALLLLLLSACSKSAEEEQQLSRAERRRIQVEDSLALKIAVLPTLDCLPLYIAADRDFYKKHSVDVRLRPFTAQMDCDTAFTGRSVEGMVSDLVRAQRLQTQGTAVSYGTKTNAYWLLLANQKARIQKADQLGDKMIAYTKHSATHLLTDETLQRAKTKAQVFLIPVNDVSIRLKMLLTGGMDAVWLTEPQATVATQNRHVILADSRKQHPTLGVIVFNAATTRDARRRQQMDALWKAYDEACDSINQLGYGAYADVLKRHYELTDSQIAHLPRLTFAHAAAPTQAELTAVRTH